VFCEIVIRRLEHYRATGELGWQNGHSFEDEIDIQFEPTQEDQDLANQTSLEKQGSEILASSKHSRKEQPAQAVLL
jgi:hypothetical protein